MRTARAATGAAGQCGGAARDHRADRPARQRTGAGEVLGSTATGVLLSPEVLRRVACDAALVPHVLGTAGEDLDLGRVVRLFTRAQRRRLWRRDRCCTYPGCAAPATAGLPCASCPALGERRRLRHRQRRAALRTTSHRGAPPKALGAGALGTPDKPGRYVIWDLTVGSTTGTWTGWPRQRAQRPATTDPTTTARAGRRDHRRRRRRRPPPGRTRPHRTRRRPVLG